MQFLLMIARNNVQAGKHGNVLTIRVSCGMFDEVVSDAAIAKQMNWGEGVWL